VQLKQGATVLRTTGYAWDNADQITSQTVNGVTTNYGYDLAGQLTSEIRTGYNVAYTYDANGNRLSKTVNGTVESYTYDLADKMLTAWAKSYTYDAAGRTVGINAPSGTTTLTYDYESRVTAISGPGINETHTYNGLDTRVGTVQGGVSRTFVRDGSYVTDPVLRDGQATYTPGVSERRGGVSTWSHSGLKNADAQTTSVGAIAATRVYDAFGAELSATGTWKGPFGYAGGFGYQEDSSGLKLLGHRYYDPTTGRFLSRDPIKDGRNWYVYVGSNPIRAYDPTGLAIIVIVAVGAVLIGAASWVRFGHDANQIIEPAREDKIDPDSNVWGDDEKLDYRKSQEREWVHETGELAADQAMDNYVYGPIGKVAGDGGQVAVEGIKEASKIRVPRRAPSPGPKYSEEELKASWDRWRRGNRQSPQRVRASDYPLPERRESHYWPSGAGMPVREH
jgi:RHS repeat-associated protein